MVSLFSFGRCTSCPERYLGGLLSACPCGCSSGSLYRWWIDSCCLWRGSCSATLPKWALIGLILDHSSSRVCPVRRRFWMWAHWLKSGLERSRYDTVSSLLLVISCDPNECIWFVAVLRGMFVDIAGIPRYQAID